MSATVSADQFEGQNAFTLENDKYRVVVLPEISGKIVSVIDHETGDELLWRNPDRAFRKPNYGDRFADYDCSGWEDCLPNISAGPYPEWPWERIDLPDHGEVWSIPWDAEIDGEAVLVSTSGVRVPYYFQKRIRLSESSVSIDHVLHNPTAFPIRYIWATHPLFAIRPGMLIDLPDGVQVKIDSTVDGRLGGYLQELNWPTDLDAGGLEVDLSLIGNEGLQYADKLYTDRVSEGWCGLYAPGNRRAIAMTFDPDELPYIGVWINQGGFPGNGVSHFNVGLEPCKGYPDALDVAFERGTAATIGPGETQTWTVSLFSGEADSVQALLGQNVKSG